MTPDKRRAVNAILTVLILVSLVFTYVAPAATYIARAQETTAEPLPLAEETASPTAPPPPTEVPPTLEPTTPPVETAAPESTEPAAPPASPTPAATLAPGAVLFEDTFGDGDAAGWTLTPGWQVVLEDANHVLSAIGPAQSAAVNGLNWTHLLLAARVRVEPGAEMGLALRASAEQYTITLDTSGQASLYRGETLLAQGLPPAPLAEGVEPQAVWRTLNVHLLGDTFTVGLDGVVQFTYQDTLPLPAGALAFITGPDSLTAVTLDDIVIHRLELSTETPLPAPTEITPAPTETALPEVTVEPEATNEPALEPEATDEPVIAPESTEEPAALTPILTADFEGELVGWSVTDGASVVETAADNRALLLNTGSALAPAEAVYLADLDINLRASLADVASSLDIAFRSSDNAGYVLALEAEQIALYRTADGEQTLVAATPASFVPVAWYTLALNARGGVLSVTLDGVETLAFTDDAPFASGQIAFTTGGAAASLVDDIAVYDLTPADLLPAPTPAPASLTEANAAKLQSVIYDVLELYLSGDTEAALAMAEDYGMPVLDDALRVGVVVYAAPDLTVTALAALVEQVGGLVDFVGDKSVDARVPLTAIQALVNTEQVAAVVLPQRAVSTSSAASLTGAPVLVSGAGTVVPHSLDILGANDWHTPPVINGAPAWAAITGGGVPIAVIDTSFAGTSALPAAERSCLVSPLLAGVIGHGARVVETICDIAPTSRVTGYVATSYATLTTAINSARAAGFRIILITLDLGVGAGPGDGTDGNTIYNPAAPTTPYDAIRAAREAGVLVIASAGNNNLDRYASFNWAGPSMTFTISAQTGDTVSLSWNDWDSAPNGGPVRENFRLVVAGVPSVTRAAGANPGLQVTIPAGHPTPATFDVTIDNYTGDSSASDFLQFQTSGTITAYPGGVTANTTRTLGRPGDATFALTVGATCSALPSRASEALSNPYPIMPSSSRGPLYASGGNSGAGPATVFKPDVVGPSHIAVYGDSSSDPFQGLNGCIDGTGSGIEPSPVNGFNGTSAAAAHIAGMSALLIANTNPDMAAFDSGAGAAAALQNYLQGHTIDRDGNGFDQAYGAGLPVLGQPNYVRSALPASALSDGFGGRTLYVSSQTGSMTPAPDDFSQPYLHPQHAIAAALAGDRVVLLPGEYVTPILVNRQNVLITSYSNLMPGAGASTIISNNSYGGIGGVVLTGNVTGTTISGFQFRGTRPRGGTAGDIFPAVRGAAFANATGGTMRNSTFMNYLAVPLEIDISTGSTVSGSLFEGNGDSGNSTTSAIKLTDSSGALLESNTFRANATRLDATNPSTFATVTFERSGGTIARSLFTGNSGEGLVQVTNTTLAEGTVNMFSNILLNNLTKGPLVHLDPGPSFRFTHNTVVGHVLDGAYKTNGFLALIVRGRPSPPPTNQNQWDVHNNIFFGNTSFDYVIDDPSKFDETVAFNSTCQASNPDGSANGITDSGATHNWVSSTGLGGDCGPSLVAPGNNNVTTVNPAPGYPAADPNTSKFVGPRLGLAITDPLYYQLLQSTVASPNPGVDGGSGSVLTSALDFRGRLRVFNSIPDIGAYELILLNATPIPNEARQEDVFTQPGDVQPAGTVNGAFRIDPRVRDGRTGGVEGGFEPYTFTVTSPLPDNYSTDITDFCGGQGVKVSQNPADPQDTKQYIYYCPPQQFYTTPDAQVVIAFEVQDTSGAMAQNTVTVNIAATEDARLTQPAGDAPWASYRLITEEETDFRLRLRPYVQFNNFSFSEAGSNTGTPPRSAQADYPFSYGGVTVWPANDSTAGREVTFEASYNPNLLGANPVAYIQSRIAAAGPDGVITLTPAANERGFMIVEYQATDSFAGPGGPGTVTSRVRLETVGSIPDRGLHDDTSFVFNYGNLNPAKPGSWTATASEPNINNTLHTTTALDDVATFNFVGEGFTLYMQAFVAGGFWDLRVDGNDLTWDPPLPNGERRGRVLTNGVQTEGFTCSTRAIFLRDWTQGKDRLTNYGFAPYTISCRDLRDGEAHTVELVNRQAYRSLRVDAFSILFKTDPLLPGFHEINMPEVRQLFAGSWQQLTDVRASNSIAMSTTSAAANDLEFSFKGTGFAIGTTLEGTYDYVTRTFKGAVYDICIKASTSATDAWVCQEFRNGDGAIYLPTFGAFRPFYGFDNGLNDVHQARLVIKELPTGARLVIDSITVFDQQPTEVLPTGTTENDVIGPIVFGNGRDDTWTFNTVDGRASNRSLHTVAWGINNAGPFISFQLPASADRFEWSRVAIPSIDTQRALICIDRASGGPAGTQQEYCVLRDLRTAPNPLVIKESDFTAGWAAAGTHTVEIFSLVNSPFNFDKVAVLDSSAPLAAGYYEEFSLEPSSSASAYRYNGTWTDLKWPFAGYASGLAAKQTTAADANVIFEMNGTGFAAYFTTDYLAGSVEICWLAGLDHTDTQVRATGTCRTYNNYLPYTLYKTPRTIIGLSAAPANFTVVIANKPNSPAQTTMKFDAVEIFNHSLPALELDQPGQRYETSFKQFTADPATTPFYYFGTGWSTVEGAWVTYSGKNYDLNLYRQGSGFAFRTSGVDLVRIVRPAIYGWATLEICANGVDFDTVAPGQNCLQVPGQQNPVIVNLHNTDERIITVTAVTNSVLLLDAVDVYNTGSALPVGQYEDDNPLLRFDSSWSPLASGLYTAIHGMRTTTNNADMLFYMNGAYVEIGAFLSPRNQLDICYKDGQFDRADYAANAGTWTCEIWPTAGTISYARQLYGYAFPNVGVRSILVRHIAYNPPYASAVIDYVNIYNSIDPLVAGTYEETHPKLRTGLMLVNNTPQGTIPAWTVAALNWATLSSPVYRGGSLVQTSTPGDYLAFDFNGTGFEIGSVADVYGSEVEICYASGTISANFGGAFDPALFDAATPRCFTYQNETAAPNYTTARSVNALTAGNYTVRVRHVDTNVSAVYPTMTTRTWNVPRLRLDYVTIYNDPLPPAVSSGSFNDSAASGGSPYLQLAPANRWRQITDWRALTYANQSFTGIVDDYGNVTNRYVGPVATLRVSVTTPGTTVILDTGNPSYLNSDQLLVCMDQVSGDGTVTADNGTCRVLTTMRTARYQVLQIGHTGPDADYRLTFRTLTPGFFNIAGFQVIAGSTLSAGIYEEFLMAGTDIKTYNSPSFGLFTVTNDANSEDWKTITLAPYTGGRAFSTEFKKETAPPADPATPNTGGSLSFSFTGTGISVGTLLDRWGSEMRICYQKSGWAAEVCETFQNEYAGVSYYTSRTIAGLERGMYTVRIENRDDGESIVVPTLPRNTQVFPARLVIDYVQVIDTGAALPPLVPPGVYNDTATASDSRLYLQIAPASRWKTFSGAVAYAYSGQSYTAVVNDYVQYTPLYGGMAAALHVNVPAVGSTTVTLNTGYQSYANSRDLQACYRRTDAPDTQFVCEMVTPGMWTSRQQNVTLTNGVNVTAAGSYLIVFRTLTPGYFLIDGFEVRTINTTVLGAGLYENTQMSTNPGASLQLDGTWTTVTSPIYSGGSMTQNELPSSQTTGGGSLEFTFEGTGFAVSTVVDIFGSEVRVCYAPDASFDGTWDGTGEYCYDYQNEIPAPNYYTLRTLTGLTPGVYRAYLANLNDGKSELTKHIPGFARYAFYPARLRLDYVQVFNTALPPVVPPGSYNEDAAGSAPYLQFAPSNRWATVTGWPAYYYNNLSYRGIGDPLGRISTIYPGSALVMQVQVPAQSAGGLATIVLDTGNPSYANSAQILACSYDAASGVRDKCEVITTAQASRFQVFSLTNSGGAPVNRTVTFSTLTTGFFNVAGFQVIAGSTLTEGVYDDYLFNAATGALIQQTGVWQQGFAVSLSKHPWAVGGTQQRTQDPNAALRFQFEGTGFSISTMQWFYGLDYQVCYEEWTGSAWGTPVCENGSNDSLGALNFQYGQSYYGLPYGRYQVEVKVKPAAQQADGAISAWEWLYVDAVAIFGDVATVDNGTGGRAPNTPLYPGMYDDADLLTSAAASFGPAGTWSATPYVYYGPPYGPWNKTEQFTIRAGSTLSLYIRGNGLTLYQQFNWINSSDVRVCLAQSNGDKLCSNFSQYGPYKYFSPIALYGLGQNQNHHIILENRAPGLRFNVDALQVMP